MGVRANVTELQVWPPTTTSFSDTTFMFERAVRSGETMRVMSKVALRFGSSKEGKHRRQSVASNWVTTMYLRRVNEHIASQTSYYILFVSLGILVPWSVESSHLIIVNTSKIHSNLCRCSSIDSRWKRKLDRLGLGVKLNLGCRLTVCWCLSLGCFDW